MELPAVYDVRPGVPVVVDLDVVERVLREWIVVRSAVRFLKRNEVRHECDVARAVRANERIHVGVVDRRVGRAKWGLAVAGRTCAAGAEARDPGGQGEPQRGERSGSRACFRDAHCSSLGETVLT
jgi:hypothetical protein